MKLSIMWLGMSMAITLMPLGKAKAQDPITEIIRQGVIKVIKAVDLKIQRLQNKTIWLQNAQKVAENKMSQLKLKEISGWVEKQRVLYEDYFEELQKVKQAVIYYSKVKGLIARQVQLVREYRVAWNGVQQDNHFSTEETRYIGTVYTGIIEESLKHLDGLFIIVNSFQTQMSDAARMELVDSMALAMEETFSDLKAFNSQNIQLSLKRAKDEREIGIVKGLYGLE